MIIMAGSIEAGSRPGAGAVVESSNFVPATRQTES